ncbi:MAG: glycosyltransferase [Herpetosiphonaceae bacterium]|nr:glycosyltransferase [Herpetosiphonaceae bacterium]
MRIAIYNRWLLTQGGGERHSLALAAVLAQHHAVTVITYQPADLQVIGAFLDLDLGALKLVVVPDTPSGRFVTDASAEYDVFIGASHTDVVVPQARHNWLLVFFPAHLAGSPDVDLLLEGWYPPEHGQHGAFRWSDAEAALVFRPMPSRRLVELHLAALSAGTRLRVLCESGESVHRLSTTPQWVRVQLPAGARRISLRVDTPYRPPGDPRLLGAALYAVRSRTRGWRRAWQRTMSADQLVAQSGPTAAVLQRYQLILANSHFTQRWIERRWGLTSQVLYPPVEFVPPTGIAKQRLIISVGRFFPGGHAKNHAVLIAAWQQLQARGTGDWRLVIVGGLDTTEPSHRQYFEDLQARIESASVTLAPNLPADELRRFYAEASLYWHAGGYGIDAEQQPELVEHFGITVAQALAAGAVPLVYSVGGPTEIVRNGVDGRHWQTVDELVAATYALMQDPLQRSALAGQGRLRAADFRPAAFEQRVWELESDWE